MTVFPLSLSAQSYIYWSDVDGSTDNIERSDLDGDNRITILPDSDNLRTIDLDPTGQKIYWADLAER